MRRTGPRTTASISLFPFLAVLMCTMGALLVVLVAIARNARQQALEAARTAQPSHADASLQARDDLAWRIEQLRAAHQATQAELADARQELAHLESHARRLRRELAALAENEAQLASRKSADRETRAQLTAELAAAEARLENTVRKIRSLADQTAQQAFAIIPYQGPHGTRRRPIYIECRADSVLLQPEGIELTEADFLLPVGPASPLASALRAANEVYARRNLRQESAGQPYPLLLVRPDGVGAYYAARSALAEWGNEFGYELIDADWNLEFPPPDPELQEAMQLAVAEARDRLKTLVAMAPRRMKGLQAPRFGAARDGLGDAPNEPTASAGSRAGGRGTLRSRARWIEGETAGLLAGRPEPERNPYAEVPLPGESPPSESGLAEPQPDGSGPRRAWRSGTSPHNSRGGEGMLPDTVDLEGGPHLLGGVPGGAGTPSNAGTSASSRSQRGGRREGSFLAADAGPSAAAAGYQTGGTSENQSVTGAGGQGDTGVGEEWFSADEPQEYPGQRGVGTQDNWPNRSLAANDSPDAAAAHATSGADASSAAMPPQTAGDTSTAGSPSTRAGAPSAAAGASAVGDPAETPLASLPEVTLGSPRRSLAERRGRDWGLPRQAARATPVTRPIKLRVEAERMLVRGENPGGRDQRVIPLGEDMVAAADELAAAVAERVETWGMAGRGMYWRPLLVVEVAPGGEARFAELQALLADSGLDIRRVPLRTADRRASYPRTQTPD